MNKRDRRPWTQDEDSIIEKYYQSKEKTVDEIAILINRKKRSIQERIKKLSLHIRPCKTWTEEEVQFLIKYYPIKGAEYCASFLGRSRDSVWQKVNSLSIGYISKTDILDQHKEDVIKDYNRGMKLKNIAEKYGYPEYMILNLLKKYQVPQLGLKNKHIKSKAVHWKGYKDITGTYWGGIIKSAKDRNIEFNIDIAYVWNLFISQNEKCALSGIDIKFNHHSQNFKTSQTASLDRIDSSKGYVEGNVQWVHKSVNFMKHDMAEDVFIDFCKLIASNRR
jgi:hypothetical protein